MLKKHFSLLLSVLLLSLVSIAGVPFKEIQLSPAATTTAAEGGRMVLKPFAESVTANALIVRCRLVKGKNYIKPVKAKLASGGLTLEKEMQPIDWMFNQAETDYELRLDKVVSLGADTQLELVFELEPEQQMEVYAIMPVVLRSDDLSRGIDFEADETSGVWVGHENGTVSMDEMHGLSGKRCVRAEWTNHGSMISMLPGQRNWKGYAALRFTIANPLPGADGRRTRVFFLYDGKTVLRPAVQDSISSGGLEVIAEGVKTFQLDLKAFAKNNPKFNLKNVKSFQIFWSPVVCGHTIFYIDDVKLLTEAQLKAEEDAKYLGRINEIETWARSAELKQLVADMRRRYAEGERASLDNLIAKAQEAAVIDKLADANADKQVVLGWAPAAKKIMRDEMPAWSQFPAEIAAAGNERESFQLVMAPLSPLKNVTVEASELVSEKGDKLPATAVAVNPIAYLEVKSNAFAYKEARPGMWPDVLMDNAPFDLPRRLQPYMITVSIPSGQRAGNYKGSLTVRADGIEPRTVEYTCCVFGFSLPVKGELKTWFSMAFVPQDKELRRQYYDIFFDYRLNPVSMYNVLNRDLPDYAKYACIPAVEDLPYCVSRGLNYLPFAYLWDYAGRSAPDKSQPWEFHDNYIKDVIAVVRKMKPIFEEAGVWDIAHVHGFDEIMHKPDLRKERLAAAVKLCKALKAEFPDLKIGNIGKLMTIDNSLMDTWFMAPEKHKTFEPVLKKGGFVGFYWAYQDPSFMLDQPGIAPRLCAWLTYKEGACGMGYYSTLRPHDVQLDRKASMEKHPKPLHSRCTEACMMQNPPTGLDWTQDIYQAVARRAEGRNCDGKLFHPAPGGRLLASQRLVNIRDGIEDFEYFKLLEKLPGDHKALLTIGDDIITLVRGDYTTNISVIETRRRAVARAIEQGAGH